jgi:putative membrane protein
LRGFGRLFLLGQLSLLAASHVSGGQVMDGGARLMLASREIDFLMRSVQSSLAEVHLGKLASERAQDPSARNFAQRMVEDHSKMIEELRKVAKQRTMTLSDILKASDQNEALQLSKLSGAMFDSRYRKWALRDHKTFVKQVKKEAKSGKDEAIRGFADKTLPIAQQHLGMVQLLAGKR